MQITDKMVESAAKAHTPQFDRMTSDLQEYALIQMRSALEAALTAAPASAGEPSDRGSQLLSIMDDAVENTKARLPDCRGPFKIEFPEDSASEQVKVKFGDMPSYGRATGNDLLAAVHAAIYGRGEVKFAEINDDHPLWHQMVPTINFDSLNRIVTAFVNGSKVTS